MEVPPDLAPLDVEGRTVGRPGWWGRLGSCREDRLSELLDLARTLPQQRLAV